MRRSKGPRPGESAAVSPRPADSTSKESKRSARGPAPSDRAAADGPAREPGHGRLLLIELAKQAQRQDDCRAMADTPKQGGLDALDIRKSGTRRTPNLPAISARAGATARTPAMCRVKVARNAQFASRRPAHIAPQPIQAKTRPASREPKISADFLLVRPKRCWPPAATAATPRCSLDPSVGRRFELRFRPALLRLSAPRRRSAREPASLRAAEARPIDVHDRRSQQLDEN